MANYIRAQSRLLAANFVQPSPLQRALLLSPDAGNCVTPNDIAFAARAGGKMRAWV